jgi:diguanylate cyclase (GGDEF)-like protein
MDPGDKRARSVIALLSGLTALYVVMPGTLSRDLWYNVVAVLCIAAASWGLRRQGGARAWWLVVAGFAGWVVGDLLFSVEQAGWHPEFPAYSDGVYLTSYLILGWGLLTLARGRQSRHDPGIIVDAGIIAIGGALPLGVFVILPIAQDSTLGLAGKLVSSAYPAADVLVAALLVRLWGSPTRTSMALRLLTCALLLTLLADLAFNVWVIVTAVATAPAWLNLVWLSSYVVIAAACLCPSADGAKDVPARAEPRARTQLIALTGGLLVPGVTLLLNGMVGGAVQWLVIGVGSILLSLLVLSRMVRLLGVVQIQAVQLAALARSDSLTGAPNRRTWDHELSRACQRARDTGKDLAVGLIDLDHFKRYNDTHGHQSGDRLLREAVAAWTDLLDAGDLLARYGGEEFAVLLPGRSLTQARAQLDALRLATPGDQTFSAGVALWDSATEPAEALRAADEALYDAKRSGRDRVSLAGLATTARLPVPTVVLQPIVDLRTGEQVAVEALSRFDDQTPIEAFARAHASGTGPELEAAAIQAALLCRPADLAIAVNVSLASLLHPRIAEVLPEDLRGVILEVTEQSDLGVDRLLEPALADLRRRGARLAVDDWGQGFSNIDRWLRLRPEVVKLDMSLVQALESDYHRAMIRSVTAWAEEVGATVCAEGVETEAQRRALLSLGVHTGQGYLFGAPARAPQAAQPPVLAITPRRGALRPSGRGG